MQKGHVQRCWRGTTSGRWSLVATRVAPRSWVEMVYPGLACFNEVDKGVSERWFDSRSTSHGVTAHRLEVGAGDDAVGLAVGAFGT